MNSLTMHTQAKHTAWDLIGFDGQVNGEPASVRIHGGRSLYEAVDYNDSRVGRTVRLARLVSESGGLRQINRYVDADTRLEIIFEKEQS